MTLAHLSDIVDFCDKRVRTQDIKDFPGSYNGLQFENNGQVSIIGAAVDAGLETIEKAIQKKVDFLICHHGLFFSPAAPVTGPTYERYKQMLENNLALYGSHLPLDGHPEIGNNAIIAQKLHLKPIDWISFENQPMVPLFDDVPARNDLHAALKALFPDTTRAITFGPERPKRLAICSGSGRSVLDVMNEHSVDTLITGELRQQHYNWAHENKKNLFICGHYATETFGVNALGREVAEKFGLEYFFLDTDCFL